jgi:hypothetical protein
MEEVKRRRGRPRKVVEEKPEAVEAVEALAVEETSAQAKLRQSNEVKKAKEGLEWTGDKYYYLAPFLTPKGQPDHKIMLVRKKKNGSTYRTYVGRASREQEFLAGIKAKGLLRDKNG